MVTDFRETLDITYHGNKLCTLAWVKEDMAAEECVDFELLERLSIEEVRAFCEEHNFDTAPIFFSLLATNEYHTVEEY